MPKDAATRILIGYWHARDGDPPEHPYSHPQPLVDHAWEIGRRTQIIDYLKSGYMYAFGCGHSYCRFGCTQSYLLPVDDPSKGEYIELKSSSDDDGLDESETEDFSGYYTREIGPLANGCRLYCDDAWCWPEGLAHYVESHGIRLPDEFVAHAARRAFQPLTALTDGFEFGSEYAHDDRFWRKWCETYAPFEYEPHCEACAWPELPTN